MPDTPHLESGALQQPIVRWLIDILKTTVLAVAFVAVCTAVISVSTSLFHGVRIVDAFVVASPGAARFGTVVFIIERYLLLYKAHLRGAMPAIAVYTLIGGIAGSFFSLNVAGWGAAIAFTLVSMSICQKHDVRREGVYLWRE